MISASAAQKYPFPSLCRVGPSARDTVWGCSASLLPCLGIILPWRVWYWQLWRLCSERSWVLLRTDLSSVHGSTALAIPRVCAFPQKEAVSGHALGAELCQLQGLAVVQSRLAPSVCFDLGLKEGTCWSMDCKCQNPAAGSLAACGRTICSLPCCGCLSSSSCCLASWAQRELCAIAELLLLSIVSHSCGQVCAKGPAHLPVLGKPKVKDGFLAPW